MRQLDTFYGPGFLMLGLTVFQVVEGLGLGVCGNLLTDLLKRLWRNQRAQRRPPLSLAERRATALHRGERAFDSLRLFLPTRLWIEDLGDALEILRQLDAAGAAPWTLYLKIVTTSLWAFVSAAREDAASLSDAGGSRAVRTNGSRSRP